MKKILLSIIITSLTSFIFAQNSNVNQSDENNEKNVKVIGISRSFVSFDYPDYGQISFSLTMLDPAAKLYDGTISGIYGTNIYTIPRDQSSIKIGIVTKLPNGQEEDTSEHNFTLGFSEIKKKMQIPGDTDISSFTIEVFAAHFDDIIVIFINKITERSPVRERKAQNLNINKSVDDNEQNVKVIGINRSFVNFDYPDYGQISFSLTMLDPAAKLYDENKISGISEISKQHINIYTIPIDQSSIKIGIVTKFPNGKIGLSEHKFGRGFSKIKQTMKLPGSTDTSTFTIEVVAAHFDDITEIFINKITEKSPLNPFVEGTES